MLLCPGRPGLGSSCMCFFCSWNDRHAVLFNHRLRWPGLQFCGSLPPGSARITGFSHQPSFFLAVALKPCLQPLSLRLFEIESGLMIRGAWDIAGPSQLSSPPEWDGRHTVHWSSWPGPKPPHRHPSEYLDARIWWYSG